MTYFLDENLPPRLLEGIEIDGAQISFVALRNKFPAHTKDPVWIPVIGDLGWIVVTLDARMSRYRIHRRLLEIHGVKVLFLPKSFMKKRPLEQKAWCDLYWRKIHAFVRILDQPYGIKVSLDGKCTALWPHTDESSNATADD